MQRRYPETGIIWKSHDRCENVLDASRTIRKQHRAENAKLKLYPTLMIVGQWRRFIYEITWSRRPGPATKRTLVNERRQRSLQRRVTARSHWWNIVETLMKQVESAWIRLNQSDETVTEHAEAGCISNETICVVVMKHCETCWIRLKHFVSRQ